VLQPINLVRKDAVTTRFLDTCGKPDGEMNEAERKEWRDAVGVAQAVLLLYRCGPLDDEEATSAIRKNIRAWLVRIRAARPDESDRPR
jgi:hypothetical protein